MRGDVVNKVNWPICQTREDAHTDMEQLKVISSFVPVRRSLLFAFISNVKGRDVEAGDDGQGVPCFTPQVINVGAWALCVH